MQVSPALFARQGGCLGVQELGRSSQSPGYRPWSPRWNWWHLGSMSHLDPAIDALQEGFQALEVEPEEYSLWG